MGAPGMFNGASGIYDGSYEIDRAVSAAIRYAELCGDEIIKVECKEGEEVSDARIVMLKAAGVGKYIKDLGVMISDTEFMLYESKD